MRAAMVIASFLATDWRNAPVKLRTVTEAKMAAKINDISSSSIENP
jgi:hypothetical protein